MTNKIFKILYIILIAIFIVSFFQLKKLPNKDKMLPEMMNEPIQASSTVMEDFNFKYRETDYSVKPMADYELWGLVVTINDIKKWYNVYHDKNSVNIKDVCVIWGENLTSNAYRDVHYRSGEWTCYTRWYKRLDGPFLGTKLSNNHLLSDNEHVRNIIKKVRIGDQLHFSGALVGYAKKGENNYRNSSLTRTDTGNGACETFFVKKAKILKRGLTTWYFLNNWSKNLFILLIILHILIFLKKIKKETKLLQKYSNIPERSPKYFRHRGNKIKNR